MAIKYGYLHLWNPPLLNEDRQKSLFIKFQQMHKFYEKCDKN
jgi:hypothetical protein